MKDSGEFKLYELFSALVGVEGVRGNNLSRKDLRDWVLNNEREIICEFCEKVFSYPFVGSISFCDQCREYKGLLPYIKGWNDCG